MNGIKKEEYAMEYVGGEDNLDKLYEATRQLSIVPYKNEPVYLKNDKGEILFIFLNGKVSYKRH